MKYKFLFQIFYALPLLIVFCILGMQCSSPPKKKLVKSEKPASVVQEKDSCSSGDCVNGSGTKDYPNGDRYVGEFKDSLPHGNGRFQYVTGEVYAGELEIGKPHGYGTLYDKSKNVLYSGYWKSGERAK